MRLQVRFQLEREAVLPVDPLHEQQVNELRAVSNFSWLKSRVLRSARSFFGKKDTPPGSLPLLRQQPFVRIPGYFPKAASTV